MINKEALWHWQLPMVSEEKNGTGYIHGNAKLHFFNAETGWSACGKYYQDFSCFEDIDEKLIIKSLLCKRCYGKYEK